MVTTITHTATMRAAIYCRVSTTVQEREGTSLETQEAACRRYADEHGYTVSEAHVYRETYSGAEFHDRPRLGELRAALRGRVLDVVIAYAVDRLSRDQVHVWLLLDEIDRAGARLEMVTESFDDTPTGKFLLSARSFAAEVEHEKIRERVGRGRLARVESGQLHGYGVDLYGYRRAPGENARTIFEPEAVVARDVFESYAGGESMRSIVRRLRASDTPSPEQGKKRSGDRATTWVRSAVYRILTEPAYAGETYGYRYQNGKLRPREEWIALPEGITPAILSRELWDVVQARLATNKGDATRNEARPYLLRDLMFCSVCGRRMRPQAAGPHNRRTYRCASRDTAAGACGASRVPGDDVERWVWVEVSAILRDPSIIAREVERARRAGDDPGLTSALTGARKRVAKIERDQERLVSDFRVKEGRVWELVEREIGRAEVERQKTLAEIADLEGRISARQQAARRWEAVEAYCERVAGKLDSLDFNGRRLALEALAVRVTANGREWEINGGVPTGEVVLSQSNPGPGRPLLVDVGLLLRTV
jgi:site-specific DNA recombinase